MTHHGEIPVWDLPVRIFHWTLAGAFLVAFVTEDELMWLHTQAGYLLLAAIGFRVVWGFIGTRHARFSDFVVPVGQALAYAKDVIHMRAKRHLGHNPAGGLMILALLLGVTLTALSGLALQGSAGEGPLAGWLAGNSRFAGEVLEESHEALANFTLLLVFVHIAGVMVESWLHDENLVRAMIKGRKRALAKSDEGTCCR